MLDQNQMGNKKPELESVTVAVPSTTAQKMEAIVHLSKAVEELSKALGSTHIVANISNCNITNAKENGISVGSV